MQKDMVMNVVTVCLLMSSLVSAGFWSPSPKPNIEKEDIIVKEGHRKVVVEYDPEIEGNTKVHISPQDHTQDGVAANEKLSSAANNAKLKAKEAFDEAKKKGKEAASVFPNLGQGISSPNQPNGRGTREVVCDAFGKCKHKITSAMGKAKDKASEAEEQAQETVSEAVGKTKDALSRKTEEIYGRAHEVKEGAKDKLEDMSSKIEDVREKGGRELGEFIVRVKGLAKSAVAPGMEVVHLLGFSTAYGMCMWVTFVSSYVLAGVLPRQQFGIVQSKVYPVYFRMLASSVMVALVGHLYGQRKNLLSATVGMAHAYNLLCCFAMILFNFLFLEPRATKVMYRRMKMEKEEGRGRHDNTEAELTARVTDHHIHTTAGSTTPPPSRFQEKLQNRDEEAMTQLRKLGERLQKLNAYSSFLNILTLMALTWHLVYLGQRLHVTC